MRKIDLDCLMKNSTWASSTVLNQTLPPVSSIVHNENQHNLLFDLSPELPWFEGHFPGNPVLAGIVQLHWAVRCAMCLLGFKSPPLEVARLKYKNIIVPPASVELTLLLVKEHQVQFEFCSPGKIHSLGRLVFAVEVA